MKERFGSKKSKKNTMPLSVCSKHGPYSSDNLCACYDEEGRMHGRTYEEEVLKSVETGEHRGYKLEEEGADLEIFLGSNPGNAEVLEQDFEYVSSLFEEALKNAKKEKNES